METRLRSKAVAIVRFKTSLPGDESTLVSTLFNSIGKQLHRRFFMRRLRDVLNRYASILSGIVPSVPSGVKSIFKEASQQDQLEELTIRLKQLPIAKVIVFLDDMDRMQRGELLTLLKIIRGVENYPKLCFVCAFNKNALVETLVRVQAVDRIVLNLPHSGPDNLKGTVAGDITADDMRAGYQFLEKFFPVQVPVPKLDDKQLDKQFDKYFDEFASHYRLLTLPEEQKAFQKRFEALWPPTVRPALHNVRKMKTYFNALKMSFALVRHEVDLIDFMCIELLRQDEPAIYEEVFRNRMFFYYPAWDIEHWAERVDGVEDTGRKKHSAVFEEIFGQLRGKQRAFVKSLLEEMFPKVREYFGGAKLNLNPPDTEQDADQQRRIHHPAHFMVYFSLHVPQGYFGTEEFNTLIEVLNSKEEPDAEAYLRDYLRKLASLKRMRFFDRISGLRDIQLEGATARALVRAVARESQVLEADDFGIGDFGGARRVVFVVANRFSHSNEITNILQDVIVNAATDSFSQTILGFSLDHEHNKIIKAWDHVDENRLRSDFAARMKHRYYKGGPNSIYAAPNRQDWQALITWYRINPDDVREYLSDEFERRPASIGKHLLWLFPSITHSADSKKFVDELFPFAKLKELVTRFGDKVHSGDDEQKKVVNRLLRDDMEGGWPY